MSRRSGDPCTFSIITVVYNAEDHIESTIQSVVEQGCTDYEYIIVDGGSSDQTLDFIERYSDQIDVVISEADRGIYDAMNKGIKVARGRYINFMNAGDRFYEKTTLAKVRTYLQATSRAHELDILYGKVVKISSEKSQFRYEQGKPLTPYSFFLSTPMCHQTMFIRSELFNWVGKYSLDFEAGSFYGWLGAYFGYRRSLKYLYYIDERIAVYPDGGYSFRMKKTIDRERLIVAKKYFSPTYYLLNCLLYGWKWVQGNLLVLMAKWRVLDRYRMIKYKLVGRAI